MDLLRLATRGSDLATTQSKWVAAHLEQSHGIKSELHIVRTIGDQRTDVALADVGSIGLFTKEVQDAVLSGDADYAVHSLKDLPAEQTPGLCLAAIPVREETRDWLVIRPKAYTPSAPSLIPLHDFSRVGTSAARRLAFLNHYAPNVVPTLLRGNVPTRLAKLADGEYDAILLAGAGLRRLDLDLSAFTVVKLDPWKWPGAPGQGALALECRQDDSTTKGLLSTLHHPESARGVKLERAMLRALGGGCGLPLGATSVVEGETMRLMAALGPNEEEQKRPSFPSLRSADVHGEQDDTLIKACLEALLSNEEA
ncbi:MAG: hydroxymethylbilane synthase [Planctomycetota bacterium]|nr:hydroxymethylbilane synthase [Planctomycetota bacterium]MDA1113708.1 hydroxymethylbilane synthase [Planctomycetota bacterium]